MSPPVAQPPDPPFVAFWQSLGQLVAKLLGTHAHAEIRIVVKDGKMQPLHIARSYLPGDVTKI